MEQTITSLKELNNENVWALTEDTVFNLVKTIQTEVAKEDRPYYMKIIGTAFEFRTISSRRRDLKQDLALYGYRFFPVENNKNQLTGIYKKKSK